MKKYMVAIIEKSGKMRNASNAYWTFYSKRAAETCLKRCLKRCNDRFGNTMVLLDADVCIVSFKKA